MGIVYIATIYVFLKNEDGTFADTGERTEFKRLNDLSDLKAMVNGFVNEQAKKYDCLIEILYERNGEYCDSDEVLCISGNCEGC